MENEKTDTLIQKSELIEVEYDKELVLENLKVQGEEESTLIQSTFDDEAKDMLGEGAEIINGNDKEE